MGDAIAPKVAEKMLTEWQEATGAELDADTQATISRAIRSGRLDFDTSSEVFSLNLVKPIELENGETVDRLEISEPTVQQISDASKTKNEFEQSMKILSYVTGQSVSVLNRMRMRDMTVAGALLNFFG